MELSVHVCVCASVRARAGVHPSAQCNFHHFIQVCCQTGFPLQSIFGIHLHTVSSPAVPMENNTSVKEAYTRVIVAKPLVTVDYLTAKSKPRSLWNCGIHFCYLESATFAVKMRRAVTSTFALFPCIRKGKVR